MFKIDPINTSIGRVKDIKNLKKDLEFYLVANGNSTLFSNIVMPTKTIFISGILNGEKDIPMFSLPVVVSDTRRENVIVLDIRSIIKSKLTVEDVKELELRDIIKNDSEYTFRIIRAVLMGDMFNNDYLRMNTIQDDLANSFSLWISTMMVNNYGLILNEVIILRIALMYHYYALMSKDDITMANIRKFAATITKHFSTTVDLGYVETILEPLTENFDLMNPKTASDLNRNIKLIFSKARDGSDKLNNLSDTAMIQMLLNTWFGDNSNETVCLSLEHPPTFAAMCHLALNNNSYKMNRLSNILDSKLKNKKTFGDNLKIILKSTNYK